jgi:nucleotide-binding universal stress UspA family protein
MYDHILLTLDGSPLAERAIPHAVALARACGAQLALLRVVPLAYPHGDPYAYSRADAAVHSGIEKLAEAERREAEGYLRRVAEDLAGEGVVVDVRCRTGETAPTIINTAAQANADLIVMATHGCSGPGHHAYGSVAANVLLKTPVPVLLVPVDGWAVRRAGPMEAG